MLFLALVGMALTGEQAKSDGRFLPRPSCIFYGAISQEELLVCQAKDDKIQWLVINIPHPNIETMSRRYPKVAESLNRGRMWYAPLIDGPLDHNSMGIHKFRIGSEQLWLTSAMIVNSGDWGNVLCRIRYPGQMFAL